MPHTSGKFCIDRNLVRWTLLNGIITRKTLQDDPTGGQELPVTQVKMVEKVTVKKIYRLPFGWPVAVFAAGLLAVSWRAGSLFVRLLCGLAGLACLYWGAKRIPARTTEHDAYRIVAPGVNPEEWMVVGSSSEITGFIEALRAGLAPETEARKQV